jgi:hypothetical protein
MHIKSIYDENEIIELATCKDYLQVREKGTCLKLKILLYFEAN